MAGSLQDQFLNAGLVDQKQAKKAKKAQHEARKANKNQGGQGGKGASPAPQTGAQDAERRAKVERDRALNAELARARRSREIEAQVKQLIEQHCLRYEEGDARFSFADGPERSVVRTLALTDAVRARVIAGEIAIVGIGADIALVPADIAQRIRERDPTFIRNWTHANSDSDNGDDGPETDDPYAKYVVPDDLVW